ncbi:hypothetical protein LTR04_004834 [Oleoguttula sp. CCFEE 6159]|nr:hypothetical protein LTR04_004834 [Oleoguttula sp. CCFEE 6159]
MSDAAEPPNLKLAELLRHPEDLDKLPALRAELTRKKAVVDSQLRVGLAEQLSVTQAGMTSISTAQQTVNLIKDEMMKIDKLCAEAQNTIRDFPQINLVAQIHRNFEQVEVMKSAIDTFAVNLEELERWLREDDGDIENQPNLLKIHYGLSQLRDVRDKAMEQIKGDGDSALELVDNLPLDGGGTLRDQFARLDDVVDWFDDHVGQACMNLIPLVQSGNNGMVVRLALIVEEEEKKDKQVRALMDAQKEYKELASRFKSIAAGPKVLRGYKEKFLEAIELSAQGQFESSNEAFLEDPDKLEKSVRWYFNDLNAVKEGMTPLMPKKWRIFRTYVNLYHRLMHDWLISLINDPELKPTHMLAVIHWSQKYYAKMRKLGATENQLEPQLLDNREPEMVREYRTLITKAVEEWMDRMSATDTKMFQERQDGSLDTDEHALLRTKTLGDMWRMLREQLLVASSSQRPDVVQGVVESMLRALTRRQKLWNSLIDTELAKYSSPTSDQEGLQPLQDWLIAIANDQIANIDDQEDALGYLSRFQREYEPLVSGPYIATANAEIATVRDGYVDLSTHCLSTFVALIFAVDFRSIMGEFFTPIWYQKKGMAQVCSTFEDYLGDYQGVLHSSLRDILVEELADGLLVRCLGCVTRNKTAGKFKRSDPFVEKIKDDVLTVFGFFERFENSFPEIKAKWRVVEGFVSLLEADKAAVPAVFERFRADYWDVQMAWVEAVVRARDDFDRGMLSAVKAKASEVYVERGVETIMSKVK